MASRILQQIAQHLSQIVGIDARHEPGGHIDGPVEPLPLRCPLDDPNDDDSRDDRLFAEARAQEIVARVSGRAGTAEETRKPSRETAPPLRQSEVRDSMVSTVFLGIDTTAGLTKGPPRMFETMVFGGPMNRHQVRVATYDEAMTTHRSLCWYLAHAT